MRNRVYEEMKEYNFKKRVSFKKKGGTIISPYLS